jgi:hypothetical protein
MPFAGRGRLGSADGAMHPSVGEAILAENDTTIPVHGPRGSRRASPRLGVRWTKGGEDLKDQEPGTAIDGSA